MRKGYAAAWRDLPETWKRARGFHIAGSRGHASTKYLSPNQPQFFGSQDLQGRPEHTQKTIMEKTQSLIASTETAHHEQLVQNKQYTLVVFRDIEGALNDTKTVKVLF